MQPDAQRLGDTDPRMTEHCAPESGSCFRRKFGKAKCEVGFGDGAAATTEEPCDLTESRAHAQQKCERQPRNAPATSNEEPYQERAGMPCRRAPTPAAVLSGQRREPYVETCARV
jgi:hypothetical protein